MRRMKSFLFYDVDVISKLATGHIHIKPSTSKPSTQNKTKNERKKRELQQKKNKIYVAIICSA